MASYYKKSAQHVAYDTAAATATKTAQVVMLYDGLIKIVQQAKQAIADKQYEERYALLERACHIIGGLQGCLDFEKGGDVAQLLNDYYGGIEMRLMLVQGNNDPALCDQVVKELKIMRDSWAKVDQKASGADEAEAASEESAEKVDPTLDAHATSKLAGFSVSV